MALGMLEETITITSEPSDSSATVVTVPPQVIRKIEERRQTAVRPCPSVTTSEGAPIGGNIRTPKKLQDMKPIYPFALRGTPGRVVLMGRLNTEGAIDEIEVISSTHPEFTDATVTAVNQWQFAATVLNCEPVPVKIRITTNYAVRN